MFKAYTFPKPNMLVQQGVRVEIHGLTSQKGQAINGCQGVAKVFYPMNSRWSVLVDTNPNGTAMKDKMEYKFRIQTLQTTKISVGVSMMVRDDTLWTMMNGRRRHKVSW